MEYTIKLISQTQFASWCDHGMYGLFRSDALLVTSSNAGRLFALLKTFSLKEVLLNSRRDALRGLARLAVRYDAMLNGGITSGNWTQVPAVGDLDWDEYKAKTLKDMILTRSNCGK